LKRTIFIIILLVTSAIKSFSQAYLPSIIAETGGQASSGTYAPFWLTANQYGQYSAKPMQVFAGISAINQADSSHNYFYGIEVFNRFDGKNKFHFQQGYAGYHYKALIGYFGLKKDYFGNLDPLLSSGGSLWSTNAPPMPTIYAGIPEYTPIPFTHNILEIKGGMSHGWFGNEDQYVKNVYLHHKYGMLRLNVLNKFKIAAGMYHAVQWGGISPETGQLGSGFKEFFWAFAAKSADDTTKFSPNETINKYGNHIASYQLLIDYSFSTFDFGFYWQTFLEDKNGRVGVDWQNKTDGVWGLSFTNYQENSIFKKVIVEYIHTTNQSGDPLKSGNDNYYNNHVYKTGWNYMRYIMGTPLITSPLYYPDGSNLGTFNNCVKAIHSAASLKIKQTDIIVKTTYSQNYGLVMVPFENMKRQFSAYIEGKRSIDSKIKNLSIAIEAGLDYGKMYGNSFGIRCKFVKVIR
jgi:hypothetical protein